MIHPAQPSIFDERTYRRTMRQALLMQVDAIERMENELARQRGEPLPYPIRTCQLRELRNRLLNNPTVCDTIQLPE